VVVDDQYAERIDLTPVGRLEHFAHCHPPIPNSSAA
jgi:hypothetical protein